MRFSVQRADYFATVRLTETMQLLPKNHVRDLKVYEPGRPLEEVAREVGLDPETLVKLASNENALGPSPKAISAMEKAAGTMHLYPDGGAYYLRSALATHIGVAENQLIFGNGSNELIELLGRVFLDRNTNIVMSECAFIIYHLVAMANEAETRMVPMRSFTHDLSAMLEAIDENTRVVFIANPNNPTGTMVTEEELKAFMQAVPPHVLVVFDEAYIELLQPAEAPDTISHLASNQAIILRTFSKAYGLAGLRVGYGVATPAIIQLLEKFRQPFNVNAMAQSAAVASLEDTDFVARTRKLVAAGLAFFEQACSDMGLETVPSVANFLLVKTGRGREVFSALQQHGVIVRPMDPYGLPDYIRITTGTHHENEACVVALKKVLAST